MDSMPYRPSISRGASRQLPFSTRLVQLQDIPQVFRKTVARLLEGREKNIRHMLYTPEFGTFGEYCPATLFVVTDHEWLAFSAEKSGMPAVCLADFTQTRLIEFSLALLEGCLVLESGEDGESPCILRFNLASRELFLEALAVILSHGRLPDEAAGQVAVLPPACEALSFGMRSTLRECLMPGNPVLGLVSWSRADVSSAMDRSKLHAGCMVLTRTGLLLIRADEPADRGQEADLAGYNRGVVFLNRAFPIQGRVLAQESIDEVEITAGQVQHASMVTVPVPHTVSAEVMRLLSPLAVVTSS